MRKFGLIGYPLSHSFSPGYFAQKFAREGFKDCSYQSFPLESVEQFEELLRKNPDLEGINVTIPYKKAVIPFLSSATEAVEKIGACNCIKVKSGKLKGYNTDVIGFKKSLEPKLLQHHTHALILGTGGSASAVEFVLQQLGINYRFVSRSKAVNTQSLSYEELTSETIRANSLIINTTPLGMFPAIESCPDIPYEYLTPDHYLFDLVYNPAETLFLKKGAEKGAVTKNGADMLVIQAEESWKIWNEE